jgi:hypothetical protein
MSHPRFKISRPTTVDDDGTPSDSCAEDAERIFRLIEDERHLCAHALYEDLKERIKRPVESSTSPRRLRLRRSQSTRHRMEATKDTHDAKELLESKQEVLEKLEVCGSPSSCSPLLPPLL